MSGFRIKGLIKFGKKEHLEALLDGVIYMNNIDYFRRYEESQPKHLRGDKYECFDYVSQGNKVIIFGEPPLVLNNITMFENRNTYPGYLYCLYAIYFDSDFTIDGRMLDFGEYGVIIREPLEFINRIREASTKEHLHPNCYAVNYYNEKEVDGTLTPFLKRDKYSYQKEARIYIYKTNPQDNMVLNIGSIKDIACIERFKRVNGI